ncbi:YVTN family beta-propeller protein [Streptacidiphilus sp. EB129]
MIRSIGNAAPRRALQLAAVALTVLTSLAGTAGSSLASSGTARSSPILVGEMRANRLAVIDPASGAVVGTLPAGVEHGVGHDPVGETTSPDGRQIYIADEEGSDVSVVDAAGGTVVATVHVGGGPTSVAFSPDGRQAYVTERAGIGVIDVATRRLVATIGDSSVPTTVEFRPDGLKAYALSRVGGSVAVIDTATDTITGTVTGLDVPSAMAVTRDSRQLFVANAGRRSVSIVDTATGTVTRTIGMNGAMPVGLVLAPDGSALYIASEVRKGLTEFNLRTQTVHILGLGGAVGPQQIQVSSDGRTAFLFEGTSILVFDTRTRSVTATIPLGLAANSITLSPNGRLIYAIRQLPGQQNVIAISTVTNAVTSTLQVSGKPVQLAFSGDSAHAFTVNATYRPPQPFETVSAIDTATGAVTDLPAAVGIVEGVAISPDGGKAYVADRLGSAVAVVDLRSGAVTRVIQVGSVPQGILASPDGRRVYVTNRDHKSVTVIDTATDAVAATVPSLCNSPGAMALSADGSTLYVGNSSTSWCIMRIDTATDTATMLSGSEGPTTGLVVGPHGTTLYAVYQSRIRIAGNGTGATEAVTRLVARNTTTHNVEWTRTVSTGGAQGGIAVSPDGRHLYIAQSATNSVWVFDVRTRRVTARIAVGAQPRAIAITHNGRQLYVTDFGSHSVSVIDTATGAVTETIQVGNDPDAVTLPGQLTGS